MNYFSGLEELAIILGVIMVSNLVDSVIVGEGIPLVPKTSQID